MQPIQMQLSQNEKKNSDFFFFFHLQNLNKIWNTLKKKMTLIGNFFPKLQTVKTGVTQIPKKHGVRTFMEGEHVKGSERLLKSARHYFCQIF